MSTQLCFSSISISVDVLGSAKISMKLSLLFLLAAVVYTSASPQLPLYEGNIWKVGQRVRTSSGPVDGHLAPNSSQVSEYLGIPFAKPPIGALRFEPPEQYVSSSLLNGSIFVCSPILNHYFLVLINTGSLLSPNHPNSSRLSSSI